MTTEFVVRGVQFMDDGVELTFMRFPDDARCEGHLVLTRSLYISKKSELGQRVNELLAEVTDLAFDAYNAHDNGEVWQLPLDGNDDDDEMGMGF